MINTNETKLSGRVKKRKLSWVAITLIALLQLVCAAFSCYLLIRFGPFQVIRQTIAMTAQETGAHQYITKWFYTDKQFAQLLSGKHSTDTSSSQVKPNKSSQVNEDSNINLYVINDKQGLYNGYLMEITNPLRVHVGYTKNLGKQGETTSDIASDHNAIAAINGGGFTDASSTLSYTGTGANPTDFLISDGRLIYQDPNFTNNVKINVVAFDNSGNLIIGKHSINDLLKTNLNISGAFSFPNKPGIDNVLIYNGNPTYTDADSGMGRNPRTAIGQTASGAILLLVLDGRSVTHPGATLYDAQRILKEKGAVFAVNLDGGSSTTMVYNGKIQNSPCDPLGERTVATAIYVEK